MTNHRFIISSCLMLFVSTNANGHIVWPPPSFDVGLNSFSYSCIDDVARGSSWSLDSGNQIAWIDLVITDHVDSSAGATDISYLFNNINGRDDYEITGSVTGDGTYRLFTGIFEDSIVTFQNAHIGETSGATSTIQWNVFVVPEPSSLALLSIGGLALMRRRRRG